MEKTGIQRGTALSVKKQSSQKSGNRASLKSGIVILMMVVAMICYYYYLSNREQEKQDRVVEQSVAQKLIDRDLINNYPPTPKEVIRYYSDITLCFYNEEYTDEELELLAIQTRMLYDDELVVNNEWGKYIIELRNDIKEFKQQNIKITSYSVSVSTDVDYFEVDDFEFARLYCNYYLVSGNATKTVEEVFLLRKDEAGHWRIYGWETAENVNPQSNAE